MKKLILPVAALAVISFSAPAMAMGGCAGQKHKDQTAEQPAPQQPAPTPST